MRRIFASLPLVVLLSAVAEEEGDSLTAGVALGEGVVAVSGAADFPDGHRIYLLLLSEGEDSPVGRGTARVRSGRYDGRIPLGADTLPPGEWVVEAYTWPPGVSGTTDPGSRIAVRVPLRTGASAEIERIRELRREEYRERFLEFERVHEELFDCWPLRPNDAEQDRLWERLRSQEARLRRVQEAFQETAREAATNRRFDPVPDLTATGILVARELASTIEEIIAGRAGLPEVRVFGGGVRDGELPEGMRSGDFGSGMGETRIPYDRDWEIAFKLSHCGRRIVDALETLGARERADSAELQADLDTLASLREALAAHAADLGDPPDVVAWEEWSRAWIGSVVSFRAAGPKYAEGELAGFGFMGIPDRFAGASDALVGWWIGIHRGIRARTGGEPDDAPALGPWIETGADRPAPLSPEAAATRLDAIDAELREILRERGRQVGADLVAWADRLAGLVPPTHEAARAVLDGRPVALARLASLKESVDRIRVGMLAGSGRDFQTHSPDGGRRTHAVAARLRSILDLLLGWEDLKPETREAFRGNLLRLEAGTRDDLAAVRTEAARLQAGE